LVVREAEMSATDFLLQLPAGVRIGVIVLCWPAIWAATSFTVALAVDVSRQYRLRAALAMREMR
jgi:hypothetical protein